MAEVSASPSATSRKCCSLEHEVRPGRRQVNVLRKHKREHSRKPDEQYPLIECCSPGPYIELFARYARPGWVQWGNQLDGADLEAKGGKCVVCPR